MNENQKFELIAKLEKWSLIIMAVILTTEILYPFSVLDIIIFYPLYYLLQKIIVSIKSRLQWIR